MKTLLSLLLILFIVPSLALEGWETDFETAKKKAKEYGKDIFIVYQRHDWDPKAYGRTERLLAEKSLKNSLEENHILLLQPQPLQKNEKPVDYNTVIITSENGLVYHGFEKSLKNGPEWVIQELEYAKLNRKKLEIVLTNFEKAEEKEQFSLFMNIHRELDDSIIEYCLPYKKCRNNILLKDADDWTGLKKIIKEEEEEGEFIMEFLASMDAYTKNIKQLPELSEKEKNSLIAKYWSTANVPDHFKNARQFLNWTRVMGLLPSLDFEDDPVTSLSAMKSVLQELVSEHPHSHQSFLLSRFNQEFASAIILFNTISYKDKTSEKEMIEKIERIKKMHPLSYSSLQIAEYLKIIFEFKKLLDEENLDVLISRLSSVREIAPWTNNAFLIDNTLKGMNNNEEFIKKILKKKKSGEKIDPADNREYEELISLEITFQIRI